jgi:D-alanyl-D-alanine carboxypeptidase
MTRTTFRNASGLPDPDNVTTARDMATLGLRLISDFPNRYHYFGTVHFNWGRAMIRNHNRMLGDYEGADGIKTGFIRDSGFNIVTSALRDGVRLVGVTMGGSSWVERDRHMGALMDQGFAQMGVAPRAPSSVMAAVPAVGAARAATAARGTVADRRAASTRSASTRSAATRSAATRSAATRSASTRSAATQARVGAGRGTTAARAATQAVAPTQRTTTPRPVATTPPRRTTQAAGPRVEQGSRASTPALPPPVPRRPAQPRR